MFYALLTGEGEGCDYTIECDRTFKKLKATTWEEARAEVGKLCGEYSEPSIAKAMILQVENREEFDAKGWYKKRKEDLKVAKDKEDEVKRKELYEKLKKEFGQG